VARAYLLLGLVSERSVDHVEQPVVLPEAEAEGNADHHQRSDQARTELVEVADRAQSLLVADGSQRGADRSQHG
jgi:hypothetical protein